MRPLKLAVMPAVFAAGLILIPASDAAAHGRVYHDVYHPHAVVHMRDRHVRFPRWLRHNYDFVRWYRINHYRYRPDVSWRRLHRHYERDYFYHRHMKKRYGEKRYGKKRYGNGKRYKKHKHKHSDIRKRRDR